MLRLDLLASPAWRGQSINCRRLVEFLLIEHMNHAGRENGRLQATYGQLVEWGITRRLIRPAIDEAEQRGLVEIEQGARVNVSDSHLAAYRLTFLKAVRRDDFERDYFISPTDEWANFGEDETPAQVPEEELSNAPDLSPKNANRCYEGELGKYPFGNLASSPSGTAPKIETAENRHFSKSAQVPLREPLIYLGVPDPDLAPIPFPESPAETSPEPAKPAKRIRAEPPPPEGRVAILASDEIPEVQVLKKRGRADRSGASTQRRMGDATGQLDLEDLLAPPQDE